MAIAFTAGTSVEGTGSASSTQVSLPSGLTDGDYTIVFISVNASSANITAPSGWEVILPDTNSANGSTSMAHAIFYRKWVSGDGSVTISHSSGRACATPVKVSGADGTTFVNTAASVTQAASGAATIVAPTITPSSTTMVCVFAGRDANNGDVLDPWTNLSAGLTKIAEANGRAATQTNAGHCIAWDEVTADTATGTRQADAAQPTTGAFGVSFALNEGAGGDPPGEATVNLSAEGTLTAARVYEGDTTFDDGTFQDWTDASAGDGVVTVTDLAAHDGPYGIDALTPTSSDKAALTKTIGPTQKARISAWWRVTVEGSAGSNVPFARIFYGTQRLADVYRQNDAGGACWLRIVKAAGGSNYWFINTGFTSGIDEWVYVEFEWDLATGAPLVKFNGVTYLDASDTPADWFDAPEINRVYLGSHENGNAGTWQMDTVTVDDFLGDNFEASANFSGTGTLTATGTPGATVTPNLSGSGTLTSSVTPGAVVNAGLSGEGLLEAVADETGAAASVNLTGTGTLSRAVVANFTASMSSSGEGTLSVAVGNVSRNATAFFSGSGTLSSTRTPAVTKSVGLSGSGTLSTTQEPDIAIGVDLGAEGSLTAQTSNSFTSNVSLSGTGTLSATTTPALNTSAALSGTGTLSASSGVNRTISVNLSASGALVPFLTSVNMKPSAAFSGSGTLSATTVHGMTATVALGAEGVLTKTVRVNLFTSCDRDGFGTLAAAVVTSTRSVVTQLAGVGTLTADTDDRHDYTFTAELADKRWNADVGLKRWEGSL